MYVVWPGVWCELAEDMDRNNRPWDMPLDSAGGEGSPDLPTGWHQLPREVSRVLVVSNEDKEDLSSEEAESKLALTVGAFGWAQVG